MRMELESVFHEQHFRTKFSPLLILAESMLTFNNKKSFFFLNWFKKERAHSDYPFCLSEKNASWYLKYHEVTHNMWLATRNRAMASFSRKGLKWPGIRPEVPKKWPQRLPKSCCSKCFSKRTHILDLQKLFFLTFRANTFRVLTSSMLPKSS